MRNSVAHIGAVAVVVLMLGAFEAAAQIPEIPRDTVLPIARAPDTVSRDSTVKDTAAVSVAPRLQSVVVKGNVHRTSYLKLESSFATKTPTLLRDIPQAVSVINRALIRDQSMQGMADVTRYVPGITMGQGEGNRDQPTIRGNSTTADFFVDGVRDDAQYYRDLYNVERVEALKGSNAMIFGRGGGGGIINRVSKEAEFATVRSLSLEGGSFDHKRGMLDVGQALGSRVAGRFNG